ncbi:MAG: hypothetical protein ABMA15_31320 [Vicinamibacterales bacterium]
MPNIKLTITHVARRTAIDFYGVEDAPVGLRQIGPVENNVVHLAGVYPTMQAALTAALGYLGSRLTIVEVYEPLDGYSTYQTWPCGRALPKLGSEIAQVRTLARNARNAIWVAR